MYGTILGFGEGRGVIVAQDESRFSFTLENWREPQPPVRGAAVNFVARDGIADDIYLALAGRRPAAPASAAPGAGAGAPGGAVPGDALRAAVAQVKAFPQLALAAAILFAFLLMTYASFGSGMGGRNDSRFGERDSRRVLLEDRQIGRFGLSDRDDASMAGLNGALSPLRDLVTVASDENEERLTRIGAESEGRSELRRQDSALGRLGFVLTLAYLVWLIPLGALGLIALHWTGRHRLARATSLGLGALCVLSGFYLGMLESAGMEVFPREARGEIRLAFSRAFDLGAAGWLIALCGLGLIVLFFVRRGTPAA